MIEKNAMYPLYLQVADNMRREIRENRLEPGTCLGSHQELAEKYDVSLITIRKALKVLLEEEMIVTRQGKGTYVSKPVLRDDLNQLTGLSTILKKNDLHAQIEVKNICFISTPDSLPEKVRKGLGEKCLYIERIHKVGEAVLAYAKLYLPEKYGIAVSKEDVMYQTIYEIYEEKHQIELGKGTQTIFAVKPDKNLSKIMNCRASQPLLGAKRESYAREGFLIEYMEAYYDAEQYEFKVEMSLSAN